MLILFDRTRLTGPVLTGWSRGSAILSCVADPLFRYSRCEAA